MIGPDAARAYWDAVERNASAEAYAVAESALASGATVPEVLDRLVADAQRRVGELWASDAWTVAREHAATAVGEHVVERLRATLRQPELRDPLVVVSAEREWHGLPALLLTARLEFEGRSIVHLGADVSTVALQMAVDDHAPRAVLVSASLSSSLVFARRHVETATAAGVPVVVGGTAFDAAGKRAERIGATAYASSANDVAPLIGDLPAQVEPVLPLRSEAAREAYALSTGAGATAGRVQARLAQLGVQRAQIISDQLLHVVGALGAALLTDDPTILTDARDWLADVGRARGAEDAVRAMWAGLAIQCTEFPHARALVETILDPPRPLGDDGM